MKILDNQNKRWIKRFITINGRIPRVLHISNVANNAYNNAKLLNLANLENHVIAFNDNYAMGCPEWEDADFTDEIKDMWNPDWAHMNLNGFMRPTWFAQGEIKTCIEYLIALCQNEKDNANRLFKKLSNQNGTLFIEHHGNSEGNQFKTQFINISTIRFFLGRNFERFCRYLNAYLNKSLSKVDVLFDSSFQYKIRELVTKLRIIMLENKSSRYYRDTYYNDDLIWPSDNILIAEFKKEFPDRPDQLTKKDFISYQYSRILFRRLLSYYDIVVGYALEGIYPLMCDKPYFCYEHGTIRDIPYESDAQGRICSLVYRKAKHVFVTNFDCEPSAKYLSPGRYSNISHAYDEDQPLKIALDWEDVRSEYLERLESDMLLFHPTRHDWVDGKGYADKANDIFLRAFAKIRQKKTKVGLVCCDWGHNVYSSKKLLSDLGVDSFVKWLNPLGIVAFTRMCKASHIVIDQFKLGSFGGVTFKALASGAPVLTYLNHELILKQYEEIPSVINCKTQMDIIAKIGFYYLNRSALKEIGIKGRKWMKKHHNKFDTINTQLKQFGELIVPRLDP